MYETKFRMRSLFSREYRVKEMNQTLVRRNRTARCARLFGGFTMGMEGYTELPTVAGGGLDNYNDWPAGREFLQPTKCRRTQRAKGWMR